MNMHAEEERLIPPTMLYRFALPLKKTGSKWSEKTGITLKDEYRLPALSMLDGVASFAEVRGAWSKTGLFFNVDIKNKLQSVWCRETQIIESDGFQVWIDTRDTHNVHRATRFCHWFLFLPTGGGSRREDTIATMLKINRAKDEPKTMNQVACKFIAKIKHGGYSMKIHIPSMAMNGWDPEEHRKIGFNYAVIDRELGTQPLSIDETFPVAEDPSLWQTLELVD